jgi:hypothetical protein
VPPHFSSFQKSKMHARTCVLMNGQHRNRYWPDLYLNVVFFIRSSITCGIASTRRVPTRRTRAHHLRRMHDGHHQHGVLVAAVDARASLDHIKHDGACVTATMTRARAHTHVHLPITHAHAVGGSSTCHTHTTYNSCKMTAHTCTQRPCTLTPGVPCTISSR